MTSNQQKRERPESAEPKAKEDVEVIDPTPPQEAQRENIPTEEVMCPGHKLPARRSPNVASYCKSLATTISMHRPLNVYVAKSRSSARNLPEANAAQKVTSLRHREGS